MSRSNTGWLNCHWTFSLNSTRRNDPVKAIGVRIGALPSLSCSHKRSQTSVPCQEGDRLGYGFEVFHCWTP